jgi:hypothetical protein
VSSLERRCGWLLRAYPGWYRRERSGEMLDTLLAASPPGRRWPSFRDTRALVTGGLRVRGWTWLASMLWVAGGTALTGYFFYVTTKPWTGADQSLGIEGWAAIPVPLQVVVALAYVASLAPLIPVPSSSGCAAGGGAIGSARPRGQVRGWRASLSCGWPVSGGSTRWSPAPIGL